MAGSKLWEQPGPDRDCLRVPARSPERLLVPGREMHGEWAGDRDMDRYNM